MSKELIHEQINDILNRDIVNRHSYFQLKHFVIGREYTNQGKMWQCLREIRTRKTSIDALELEIAEANDRIELLNIDKQRNSIALHELTGNEIVKKLATRETTVKKRQIERQIGALKVNVSTLKERMADYEEEAKFFVDEFISINEIEPMKPTDDLNAQREYWTAKLFQEINLKILLGQPIDPEVVKLVLSLNNDSPLKQQMLALLESNRKAIFQEKNPQGIA